MGKNHIWIIGTGPGSKEYLTQAAIEKINGQDLLVGSQKALNLFSHLNKEEYVFKNDTHELVEFLKNNYLKKKTAVLVTGDPGIYSLGSTIKKHFKPDSLRFIPGISSIQLFFAKIGMSFEDVKILSVHGKPITGLINNIKNHNKVCILTDSQNSPQKIAKALLENNIQANAWIGQNISMDNELLAQESLQQLSQNGDYPNSLVYLEFKESK
jgi:cobalt-precorrin-7 (C5)-methyltransferase